MDFTFLKDLSLIIGIWIAIYGIDSWRREHTGKRSIELAEETLALFYEAKDTIAHIRHPASSSSETESVERGEGESEEQWGARKSANIVFERYNRHKELFNKIHSIRYRFMAQIGKEEAEPFDELNRIVGEIFLAARMLARLWPRSHFRTAEQQKTHFESIEKHTAVFWDSNSEDDPINPRLDKIISDIEKSCQNVIFGKSTRYSWRNKLSKVTNRFSRRGTHAATDRQD